MNDVVKDRSNVRQFDSAIVPLDYQHRGPRTLSKRADALDTTVRRHKLPIRRLGFAPVPSDVFHIPGQQRDWLILPARKDPTLTTHGVFPAPKGPRTTLARVAAAGIDFDAILIAHDVPRGVYKDGGPLPVEYLLPPHRQVVETTNDALARATDTFGRMVVKSALGIAAASTAATAAVARGAANVSAAIGRDPIIFGVLVEDGNDVGAWYYLTHWAWRAPR